jgi:WD40 repeat protein
MKPGGRWLLSASSDGTVKLWDYSTKKDVATFRKHPSSVAGAAFLPSGTRTLSLDRELGTKIWDISAALKSAVTTVVPKPVDPPTVIPPAKD